MNKYIEYTGESGKVIIDDNSQHLMISRVITLADCTEYAMGYNTYWSPNQTMITYLLDGIKEDEVLIAIRPKSNNDEIYFGFQWHPSYNSYCYITVFGWSDKPMPNPKDVYLYIYTAKPNSEDKFGLEIYNESGEKIFHSSNALLNILHTEFIPEDVDVYGNGIVNHPKFAYNTGDKKIAMAILSPWSSFEVQIYGFFQVALINYLAAVCWTNAKEIKFVAFGLPDVTMYGDSAALAWYAFYLISPFTHLMVIDVTNIPVPE